MEQRASSFTIKAANKEPALNAIKQLATQKNKMSGGSWSGGKELSRNFSWVATEDFVDAKTLVEAFEAWRWSAEENKEGDICRLTFEGQKLGDDPVLLGAIAEFVEDGSYLEMIGEDGSLWRWAFEKGGFSEYSGIVSWSKQ
jgi:hypothetical protein